MPWNWVSDLTAHGQRKKAHNWDIRCPYALCPSAQPFTGAHKPRLKFIQKISLFLYQYKCKDCGNLFNCSVETPNEINDSKKINPAIWGGKPGYKFHV